MAISVLSGSPQAATPVYNKMLFKVSGSLTSATNYRYVCDVKNAAGTTTLARLKCDKLPSTNYGFFDVSRVVETLIAPQAPSTGERGQFYDHAGFYSGYRLTFMEEYGSTPVVQTGTTTNVTGNIAFAGNLEQLEYTDWVKTVGVGQLYPFYFNATPSNIKALTTTANATTFVTSGFAQADVAKALKDTLNVVTPTQAGWVAISSPIGDYWTECRIQYWNADGTSIRNYFINNTTTSGTTNNIIRFPSGPRNIKAILAAQASDSYAGSYLFPTAEGAGYSVHFERSGAMSEPMFYRIGPCQRFNSQPVHFVNKYGGIDSYTFTLKNRKRANVQRDTFGYNSDVYATLTYDKVWAGSFDYVYALNSDWLTDAESEWLIELVRSGQVWLELDGQLVEAVVNANQYQFVTRRNDQLQQLQIEIAVAYKNNIL
jgi:hypothetical protein